MKKELQLLLLICILGFSANEVHSQIAMFSVCSNETFSQTGTTNGRPSYTSPSGHTILWNNPGWLSTHTTLGEIFYNNSNTALPPCSSFSLWTRITGSCGDDFGNLFSGVSCSAALPVELISFSGLQVEKGISLKWATASEVDNEKFELEASQDGREFQKIGEEKGRGTTVVQQNYSFDIENPRNGISYYRLKQIDFDGQFEYSQVISVDYKGENGEVGEFYPNPSKSGILNLDYSSRSDDEIIISVFDVTGKLVDNQTQQISKGSNNLSVDFSDLNTGIYIVKIGDERNFTHRKVLIEK